MESVVMRLRNVSLGKRERALTIILAFVASLAVTLAGALSSMSTSEAHEISKEVKEMLPDLMSVPAIFRNNFLHCLLMFTPVFGLFYAFYVLYSTGRVLAALAMVSGINPGALFGITFFLPHAWIEYTAYALAMSQGVWLVLGVAQRRFKAEAKNTGISIVVCALLLLSAAAIEMALLQIL